MSGQPPNDTPLDVVEMPEPLPSHVLRRTTDPTSLPRAKGDSTVAFVGQDRAIDAIAFGTTIRKYGFNLFVLGPRGSGRHSAVRDVLEKRAPEEAPPDDWVYVNNFQTPHKPRAIRLPVGTAIRFRDAMDALVADLGVALPALFESDEYKARRGAIDEEAQSKQEDLFEGLNEKARSKSISIMRTPMGFGFAPQRNGEAIKPEVFQALEQAERDRIQGDIEALQAELRDILNQLPRFEKDRRDRIRALNKEMATGTVMVEIAEVAEQFSDVTPITDFLEQVSTDVVENVEAFLETEAQAQAAAMPIAPSLTDRNPRLKRYTVNVMVGSDGVEEPTGAPIVFETNPTYQNIIGRVEHAAQMGALVTDFTMIKPGALHQANGGYLVVDVRELLMQPGAWEGLKRSLRSGEIQITSVSQQLGLSSTAALEPDPIPLSVKVVLVGDRMLYYLLHAQDPEFAELFKVQADFDDDVDRSDDTAANYVGMIVGLAAKEKLRPIDPTGLARLFDEAARLADDAEKLTLRVGAVTDILQEADHWASEEGNHEINAGHVERAVTERDRRGGRLRERIQEQALRETVLIDTDGAVVGQVNGLSVLSLGDQRFGKPSRITARVRMGTGKVVDIEREVELGGPLHSKGVLILSGYLSARYARDLPVSLSASLVFEQSYGGVDGDSASSAELYALLSALSGVPIKQSFAVTGSVNQFGEVQAIGGVNEKIEGFFDLCEARGLTGDQGVLIPVANVKHLMLRDRVVAACREGQFAVHAVETIDQGIEILTGVSAGGSAPDSGFAAGSINGLVETRLVNFAQARRAFGSRDLGESDKIA